MLAGPAPVTLLEMRSSIEEASVMPVFRQQTRRRLDDAKRLLAREFDWLPGSVVAEEVDAVACALAERARFDDYIPILAHRFARERLLEAAWFSQAA